MVCLLSLVVKPHAKRGFSMHLVLQVFDVFVGGFITFHQPKHDIPVVLLHAVTFNASVPAAVPAGFGPKGPCVTQWYTPYLWGLGVQIAPPMSKDRGGWDVFIFECPGVGFV